MTIRSTTILAVKHNGKVTVAGDGQVTLDTTILKHAPVRFVVFTMMKSLWVFAGATADAFTYSTGLIKSLEQYNGNLLRAAVELTKDWRTDRVFKTFRSVDDCGKQR